MKVIAGRASEMLASRVAEAFGCDLALTEFKLFPDGELYTRIVDDVASEEVLIVQSTLTDTDFICLLQLIDACVVADSISVVIPYFGYARQDKRFKAGEGVTARALARTIEADRVFTINIHNPGVMKYFTSSARDLNAAAVIGDYIDGLNLTDPLVIAPDGGAKELAASVAAGGELDWDWLRKKRISDDEVVIEDRDLAVADRDVIIVDDIISSGGTIIEAANLLKRNGAGNIYAGCIHGVFVRNALLRLKKAKISPFSTDTIETITSSVSVAGLIRDALL
ncbi:MAG: ribose-phosphate diphosphokinase [Candidatus Syntrophoarchaeum sp.]|nr:ribose-phosphate diphosphokinase [Candidatus Syntrophoarchaeum sp.]